MYIVYCVRANGHVVARCEVAHVNVAAAIVHAKNVPRGQATGLDRLPHAMIASDLWPMLVEELNKEE